MKMKFLLVTILAAALVVSADCQAMIRVGRTKVTRPSLHLHSRPDVSHLPQKLQEFKGQAVPHITKQVVAIKALHRNLDNKIKAYQNKKDRLAGAFVISAGAFAAPFIASLSSDVDWSIITAMQYASLPFSIPVNLMFLSNLDDAEAEVHSAVAELETFAKIQKQKIKLPDTI